MKGMIWHNRNQITWHVIITLTVTCLKGKQIYLRKLWRLLKNKYSEWSVASGQLQCGDWHSDLKGWYSLRPSPPLQRPSINSSTFNTQLTPNGLQRAPFNISYWRNWSQRLTGNDSDKVRLQKQLHLGHDYIYIVNPGGSEALRQPISVTWIELSFIA